MTKLLVAVSVMMVITIGAEAKRLLAQGNTKLDRDHDGIPCEKLCK